MDIASYLILLCGLHEVRASILPGGFLVQKCSGYRIERVQGQRHTGPPAGWTGSPPSGELSSGPVAARWDMRHLLPKFAQIRVVSSKSARIRVIWPDFAWIHVIWPK